MKYDLSPTFQLTGAIYNLDRFNQRLADPNNPGFFILSGKTSTQGLEIGANGYVTDWWQIAGGYALTDARIASATSSTIVAGNTVGLVPVNAFTLWNKFAITKEFSVGVGVLNYTHIFASSDDTVRLPGYTRIDLGLFYQVNEFVRAQVNIENLFDRALHRHRRQQQQPLARRAAHDPRADRRAILKGRGHPERVRAVSPDGRDPEAPHLQGATSPPSGRHPRGGDVPYSASSFSRRYGI